MEFLKLCKLEKLLTRHQSLANSYIKSRGEQLHRFPFGNSLTARELLVTLFRMGSWSYRQLPMNLNEAIGNRVAQNIVKHHETLIKHHKILIKHSYNINIYLTL